MSIFVFGDSHVRRISGFDKSSVSGLKAKDVALRGTLPPRIANYDAIIIILGSNDIDRAIRKNGTPYNAAREVFNDLMTVVDKFKATFPHLRVFLVELWRREKGLIFSDTRRLINSFISGNNRRQYETIRMSNFIKRKHVGRDDVHLTEKGYALVSRILQNLA